MAAGPWTLSAATATCCAELKIDLLRHILTHSSPYQRLGGSMGGPLYAEGKLVLGHVAGVPFQSRELRAAALGGSRYDR